MTARVKWNGQAAKRNVREEMAKRLLAAAVTVQAELKKAVSVNYPPASLPGQFPHLRTGWGRAHVWIRPDNLKAIARNLETHLGYAVNAKYMVMLELYMGRLGIEEIVKRTRSKLGQVVSAKVVGGA